MPRICPNCSERFSRSVARRAANQRSLREEFKFKPLVLRCPNCGAALRCVVHPVGHVVYVIMTLGMLAFVSWLIFDRSSSLYEFYIGLIIIFIFFIWPLSMISEKWGFSYVVTDDADGALGRGIDQKVRKISIPFRLGALVLDVVWFIAVFRALEMPNLSLWALIFLIVVSFVWLMLFVPPVVTGVAPAWFRKMTQESDY